VSTGRFRRTSGEAGRPEAGTASGASVGAAILVLLIRPDGLFTRSRGAVERV